MSFLILKDRNVSKELILELQQIFLDEIQVLRHFEVCVIVDVTQNVSNLLDLVWRKSKIFDIWTRHDFGQSYDAKAQTK